MCTAEVVVPLALLAILEQQMDKSLRVFTHEASAPELGEPKLRALLDGLQAVARHRSTEGRRSVSAAARAFRQQGNAVIASSAASVVAVINSGP